MGWAEKGVWYDMNEWRGESDARSVRLSLISCALVSMMMMITDARWVCRRPRPWRGVVDDTSER